MVIESSGLYDGELEDIEDLESGTKFTDLLSLFNYRNFLADSELEEQDIESTIEQTIGNLKEHLEEYEKKMEPKTSRDYIQLVINFIKDNKLNTYLLADLIDCLSEFTIDFEFDNDMPNFTIDDILELRETIMANGILDNDATFTIDCSLYNLFSNMSNDNIKAAINDNKECWNFDAMVRHMVYNPSIIPLNSIYKNKNKIDRNWSFLPQEVFDGENEPDVLSSLGNDLFTYISQYSSKNIKDIFTNLNGYLSDDLRALVEYEINYKHFMEIIKGKDFDDEGNEIVLDDVGKKEALKTMHDTLGKEKMDELVNVAFSGYHCYDYCKKKTYSKDDAIADSVRFACLDSDFDRNYSTQGFRIYQEFLLAEKANEKRGILAKLKEKFSINQKENTK